MIKKYIIILVFLYIIQIANASTFIGNNSNFTIIVEDGEGSPFIAQNTSASSFLLYIGNDYLANLTEAIILIGGGGGGSSDFKPQIKEAVSNESRGLVQQEGFGGSEFISNTLIKKIAMIFVITLLIVLLITAIYTTIIKKRKKVSKGNQ